MIDDSVRAQYIPTIGIECHVQLKTKTKLFAAVGNDAREAAPNTLISHICLGMPGALPVLNQKVIELAVRFAKAVHTEPQAYSFFERKHYFYPDLPKGYQITQLSHPIISGGHVAIELQGGSKQVRLNRVQIEEDAGKSSHPIGKDYSLVDLNRAGTPLFEIVSEPDMHSAEEAKAYVKELYLIVRYADISEADLFHGNMRFDVNVSVSKEAGILGTRTETKNLNSFRSVEKSVEYEVSRQIEQLEKGEKIVQETRGWDDAKQKTFSQRSKEDAHDYRYMPDPDLPPVEITPAYVEEIASSMPALPGELRQQLKTLNLDGAAIETLLLEMPAGRFIINLLERSASNKAVKRIANWLTTDVQARVSRGVISWGSITLNADALLNLAKMVEQSKVNSTGAKTILFELIKQDGDPMAIAESKNLLQISDEDEIAIVVDKVLQENSKAAEDVKNGEMKAIGFLVGQVMKLSHGKANPALAQNLIKKRLEI